jgi:hypothetical protein
VTATQDLFQFWAGAKKTNFMVHPADEPVLRKYARSYQFPLDTLVGPFMGPARNAPIILLYANGGRSAEDLAPSWIEAQLQSYADHLSGEALLPLFEAHPPARRWTEGRIKPLGIPYGEARKQIAFLNIVPYKTQDTSGWSRKAFRDLIEELPSVGIMRHWLHDVLIPEAIAEKRLVVCLRSAGLWGLEPGEPRRGGLFTPRPNRGGFVPDADRPAIREFIRDRLGIPVMDHPARNDARRRSPGIGSRDGVAKHDPTAANDATQRSGSAAVRPTKSVHDTAWRDFRRGRLEGEGAQRLMNALIRGIFPERQRVRADWRRELFSLYRRNERISDFVKAGMAHRFVDERGFQEVRTLKQMLDHVCWDVSGRFITIDEG